MASRQHEIIYGLVRESVLLGEAPRGRLERHPRAFSSSGSSSRCAMYPANTMLDASSFGKPAAWKAEVILLTSPYVTDERERSAAIRDHANEVHDRADEALGKVAAESRYEQLADLLAPGPRDRYGADESERHEQAEERSPTPGPRG